MGYTIVRFESTPNPNAIKCVLDRPISDRPRSYLNAEAAADEPIAAAFFALGGIRNILMNGDWISFNKLDDVSWVSLKPKLKRVLGNLPAADHTTGAEGQTRGG